MKIATVTRFGEMRFFMFLGMVVIDKKGNMAAGTSTNGANHKIPGYSILRVGRYLCKRANAVHVNLNLIFFPEPVMRRREIVTVLITD